MSYLYDRYLATHKENVLKGFRWMQENIPDVLGTSGNIIDMEFEVIRIHDASKSNTDEYMAYDNWFYGNDKSYAAKKAFNEAWLLHIHRNPHHWQYWILINDDPGEGEVLIDIPYEYIIEMICDWWTFSWSSGDLTLIFGWYDEHKDTIKMSASSRSVLEYILNQMKSKLEEGDVGNGQS